MAKLPKKLLRIEELTFILPDDFDGGAIDAMETLLEYIKKNEVRYLSDNDSTMVSLLTSPENPRLCFKYGIFEKVDDQPYKLMEQRL